jgi:hypothetical protein
MRSIGAHDRRCAARAGGMVLSGGRAPAFYVLMEGRLRIVLDVHGKQTEIAEHEFKPGDFLGEVPLSDWYSDVRLIASSNLLPHRAPG